jgi:nucleoprotein TPR
LDTLLAQRGAEKSASSISSADLSGRAFSALGKEKQLEVELSRALEENAQLNEQVSKGATREQELTAIIASTEEQLKQMTVASKVYRGKAEVELARTSEDRTRALDRITQLQSAIRQTEVESQQLRESMESKLKELSDEKTTIETEKKSLSSEMVAIRAREASILADVQTHAKLARDAQDQYQRELMAHAADVKSLSSVRAEVDRLEAQVATDRMTIADLTNQVASLQASQSRQDEALQSRLADLESKKTDLSHQNELLLSQLESVSLQARRAQEEAALTTSPAFLTAVRDGTESVPAPASSSSDKELKDLREIVRYMRREKEILTVELEKAKQEQVRAQALADHNSARLTELQQQMSEEIKKAATSVHSITEQASIAQQLNQLNLLQESNAMLR